MHDIDRLAKITDARKRPPVDVSVRSLVTDPDGDVICAYDHGIANEIEYRKRSATIARRYS